MGSTILTVIVLVVMWVVVLVPMFARRNEESLETAGGRLGGAVRILARRNKPAPHVSHADDTEIEDAVPDETEDIEALEAEEVSEVDDPAVVERPMPSSRAQMLARRRRTLGTIVMLAVMTALLAAGWRPRIWLVQVALDVLLVGYLWWLRQEVRRERQRRARRARRREPVARTESRPGAARPVRRTEPVEKVAEEAVAEPVDDGRWEPRPVPTPTYVNAAIHQRRPGERQHETVALDDQDPDLYAEFEDDYPTLEIIAPPRAVNE